MKTLMIAGACASLLLAGSAWAQTPAGSPAPTDGATGSAQTSSMPASGASTMSNAPAGDAPSSYPMCTKKGQDRCKSTGRRGK